MILSALIGLLVGLLLGGRFKIFATVPIQGIAVVTIIAPAVLGHGSLSHQVMLGVAFCVALQIGYIARLLLGIPGSHTASLKPPGHLASN